MLLFEVSHHGRTADFEVLSVYSKVSGCRKNKVSANLGTLRYFMFHQAAHQSGEDEVSLSTMGRAYTIDFNSMQQINEDTGTARSVQRKVNPFASSQSGSGMY